MNCGKKKRAKKQPRRSRRQPSRPRDSSAQLVLMWLPMTSSLSFRFHVPNRFLQLLHAIMPSMPGGRSSGTGHDNAAALRPPLWAAAPPWPFSVTDLTSGSIMLSRQCTSFASRGGRANTRNSDTATAWKNKTGSRSQTLRGNKILQQQSDGNNTWISGG